MFFAASLALLLEPSQVLPADLGAVARDPQKIVGGERVAPGTFPEVVALQVGSTLCTATLVAPDLIWTAAHCFLGTRDPDQVTVHYGDRLGEATMSAIEVGQHPDFCGREGCLDETYDYAYVRLAEELTLPSYPEILVTQEAWDTTMVTGQALELVGFGAIDPAAKNLDNGHKRHVSGKIDRLSDQGYIFYAGGDGRDSCSGDSGGPAFAVRKNGSRVLVGILSQGSNPCGKGGLYGVPLAALPWWVEATGYAPAAYDEKHEVDTSSHDDDESGCRIGGAQRLSLPWILGPVAWVRRRRFFGGPEQAR